MIKTGDIVTVTLTPEQEAEANAIGERRHQSHEDAGRFDWKARSDAVGVELHKAGARAEKAISVAFGVPWTGMFKPLSEWHAWKLQGHDVGSLEVRSTNLPYGSLILHDRDHDDSPFILVITKDHPTYKIVGWVWGRDGKKSQYWKEHWPRPCYGLPQTELRPISELFQVS